jgi:uncharacterized coiled-coil protein SlyX
MDHICLSTEGSGCLYCMIASVFKKLDTLEKINSQLAIECINLKKENKEMDAKIKKIEKKEKSVLKDTKSLLKADKKQDKKMASMKKKGC